MNSLDWSIGLKVKVTTNLDNVIQGKVYAFDQVTNTLALEQENGEFQLVKSPFIKDIAVVEKQLKQPQQQQQQRGFGQAQPAIGPVSITSLKKREKLATEQEKKVYMSKGVGVSPEAQFVYDWLARTLPCRWNGKAIVVFDEVLVSPPYTPESCRGGTDKVLSLVRQNIAGALEKMDTEVKGG